MRGKVLAGAAGRDSRLFLYDDEKYRLFQLADLICTLHLEELKLLNGEPMTTSEFKFFGGPKAFNHNVLRRIKAKEI